MNASYNFIAAMPMLVTCSLADKRSSLIISIKYRSEGPTSSSSLVPLLRHANSSRLIVYMYQIINEQQAIHPRGNRKSDIGQAFVVQIGTQIRKEHRSRKGVALHKRQLYLQSRDDRK